MGESLDLVRSDDLEFEVSVEVQHRSALVARAFEEVAGEDEENERRREDFRREDKEIEARNASITENNKGVYERNQARVARNAEVQRQRKGLMSQRTIDILRGLPEGSYPREVGKYLMDNKGEIVTSLRRYGRSSSVVLYEILMDHDGLLYEGVRDRIKYPNPELRDILLDRTGVFFSEIVKICSVSGPGREIVLEILDLDDGHYAAVPVGDLDSNTQVLNAFEGYHDFFFLNFPEGEAALVSFVQGLRNVFKKALRNKDFVEDQVRKIFYYLSFWYLDDYSFGGYVNTDNKSEVEDFVELVAARLVGVDFDQIEERFPFEKMEHPDSLLDVPLDYEEIEKGKVPSLPSVENLPKLKEQLRVHTIRIGFRGELYRGVLDVFSGKVKSEINMVLNSYQNLYWWQHFVLKRFRMRFEYSRKVVDEVVEDVYEMLSFVSRLIDKGNFLYEKGVNDRQKYEGRVLLKMAEILCEGLPEILVEIESSLAFGEIALPARTMLNVRAFKSKNSFQDVIDQVDNQSLETEAFYETSRLLTE